MHPILVMGIKYPLPMCTTLVSYVNNARYTNVRHIGNQ